MASLTLNDLLTPDSESEVFEQLVTMMASSDLPVTAWQEGGVALTMLEKEALLYAEMGRLVQLIARGGFLDTASGAWLTLLASDLFSVDRIEAVSTVGRLVLHAGAAGPTLIVPGQLTVRFGDLRFSNTSGGLLPPNGTLALEWRAKAAGAAHNAVPVGATLELGTSLPGVKVTATPIGATASWITTVGADAEGDESLRTRARARWPKLGRGGGTAACYEAWARETPGAQDVQKVRVAEAYPAEGEVTVFVYGSTSPVSDDVRNLVRAYLQDSERRPLCVRVFVEHVVVEPVSIVGTIHCRPSHAGAVVSAAIAALTAFEGELGISEKVYRAEIVERLMRLDGVVNVVLTSPVVDIAVAPGAVARFATQLSKVVV